MHINQVGSTPPDPLKAPVSGGGVVDQRRRPASITCPWCGTTIPTKTRGRTPKWCSNTCRHRAWEQQRAAQSGRSAVEIVEQPIVVERTTRVPVPKAPKGPEWAEALAQLARQLDTGRIYDRDLWPIAKAADVFNAALQRRLQRPSRRYW